jgi:anti-sigma B factor antagonist
VNEALATVSARRLPSDKLVLTVTGEIDISNADQLRRELVDAMQGSEAAVIDLTPVAYMDSQGMKVLADLAADHGDLDLALVAPPDSIVGELLAIVQLHWMIPVLDTLDGS